MKHCPSSCRRTCAVLFAAVAVCPGAQAGNTWTGGGASTNWSDNNNWGGAAPTYGTLTFITGGTQGTTSVNNSITAQNRLYWDGTSSWTLNNSGGTILSLYDSGGTQAKIENSSTGLVTINAPITFAANNGSPPNPFGEINAIDGDLTFGTGPLTVNGSSVNGIKLFGNGHTTTFNGTVAASGKWFATTAENTTIAVGGAFTSGDIYVMNNGTLKINSGATLTTSAVRLGGDFGTTGNQNQTLGAKLQFTDLTGGQSFGGTINTTSGNSSNALLVESLNTSGTNTLSGGVFLDSDLKTLVSAGGALSFSGGSVNVKDKKFTIAGDGTTTFNEPVTSSLGAGGFIVKEGTGVLILQHTSNSYTGTASNTLNANGTRITGGTLGIYGDGSLGLVPAGAYNNIQFQDNGTLQDTANDISLHANRRISISAGKTATFDSNGNTFTINGVINGTSGNVAKSGAGVVVLNGNNSYTGTTQVLAGTLYVNGTHTGGDNYSVSSGATLGGSGTIDLAASKSVAISAGGKVAPGTSAGKLTVDASFSLANDATAVTEVEISDVVSAGTFDQLEVKGSGSSLTINGSRLNVIAAPDVQLGTTGAGGYKVISLTSGATYSSSSNVFANLNGQASSTTYDDGGMKYTVFYNNNDGIYINFSYVPEPSGAMLLSIGAAAMLRRRHRLHE